MSKFIQDSGYSRAIALCEAVLSGEASKQILEAARRELSSLPAEMRKMVARQAVNSGVPGYNRGSHHDRQHIPCALAWF